MSYVLGFDLGTSSCKAALYNKRLEQVCAVSREYPTFFPAPGWAEQPAGQWWEAFCLSVPECLEKAGVNPAEIAAVAIDSMGSAALPVDSAGEALHPGLLWMDRRSAPQCEQMNRQLGERLFEITGNRNDPSNIASKLLWYKQERPEVYRKTHKFLHANGYLALKLTGEFTQDRTEGGLTMLYDIRENRWSGELIESLGLDMAKLPDIYESHDFIGAVTPRAAAECGLRPGIPVTAGAMDCVASALGTACIDAGDVFITGGTVTNVGIVNDGPSPHEALHLHNHIIPGKYIRVSNVDFGGGGLRWFRDILGENGYEGLNRAAELAPPGNDGLLFLPYMVGQRSPLYNNNTSGVMFGLNPRHRKDHLVRMFMEGTSYAVRNILGYFEEAGTLPRQARLTGGISNSDIWNKILCDIIGIGIGLPDAADVATLGVAVSAAVAAGWYGGYREALAGLPCRRNYTPDESNKEVYDRMFGVYRQLFNGVLPVYDYANIINEVKP